MSPLWVSHPPTFIYPINKRWGNPLKKLTCKEAVFTNNVILVKCPKCKHDMNYLPQQGMLTSKSKRCVYCGHTFKIHSNLKKSRIVKVE